MPIVGYQVEDLVADRVGDRRRVELALQPGVDAHLAGRHDVDERRAERGPPQQVQLGVAGQRRGPGRRGLGRDPRRRGGRVGEAGGAEPIDRCWADPPDRRSSNALVMSVGGGADAGGHDGAGADPQQQPTAADREVGDQAPTAACARRRRAPPWYGGEAGRPVPAAGSSAGGTWLAASSAGRPRATRPGPRWSDAGGGISPVWPSPRLGKMRSTNGASEDAGPPGRGGWRSAMRAP